MEVISDFCKHPELLINRDIYINLKILEKANNLKLILLSAIGVAPGTEFIFKSIFLYKLQ